MVSEIAFKILRVPNEGVDRVKGDKYHRAYVVFTPRSKGNLVSLGLVQITMKVIMQATSCNICVSKIFEVIYYFYPVKLV